MTAYRITATDASAHVSHGVRLDADPGTEVTITIIGDDDVRPSPSELTFGSANWRVPQFVFAYALDDDVEEPTEDHTLRHVSRSSNSLYHSFVDGANCTTFDPTSKEGGCDLSMLNDRPVFVPGDEALFVIDDNDRGAVRVEGSSFFAPSDVHDGPEGHEFRRAMSREEFSRDRHSTGASEGGESGTFWVSLTSDPDESHGRDSVSSSAVTVAISGSSPDWVADPLSLTFTRENWREAQPFTLSAVDDEVDELLEMHFAAISSHSSVALYDEHLPMSSLSVESQAYLEVNESWPERWFDSRYDESCGSATPPAYCVSDATGALARAVRYDPSPSGVVELFVHDDDTAGVLFEAPRCEDRAASSPCLSVTGLPSGELDDAGTIASASYSVRLSSDPDVSHGLDEPAHRVTIAIVPNGCADYRDDFRASFLDPTMRRASSSVDALVFSSSNWDVPQIITVAAHDDVLTDEMYSEATFHPFVDCDAEPLSPGCDYARRLYEQDSACEAGFISEDHGACVDCASTGECEICSPGTFGRCVIADHHVSHTPRATSFTSCHTLEGSYCAEERALPPTEGSVRHMMHSSVAAYSAAGAFPGLFAHEASHGSGLNGSRVVPFTRARGGGVVCRVVNNRAVMLMPYDESLKALRDVSTVFDRSMPTTRTTEGECLQTGGSRVSPCHPGVDSVAIGYEDIGCFYKGGYPTLEGRLGMDVLDPEEFDGQWRDECLDKCMARG